MGSLTVPDLISIQSMKHSYLIGSEIQGKITGPLNIGHKEIQKYEGTRSVKLNKNLKYDAYL